MSDTQQILMGFALIVAAVGLLMVCIPRNGRRAWFVGSQILESGVSILMISMFVIGVLLVASYFTTIDDVALTGVTKHL